MSNIGTWHIESEAVAGESEFALITRDRLLFDSIITDDDPQQRFVRKHIYRPVSTNESLYEARLVNSKDGFFSFSARVWANSLLLSRGGIDWVFERYTEELPEQVTNAFERAHDLIDRYLDSEGDMPEFS